MELRPYQTDIINQTINSDESTLIQVPTGGGKTVIAKEIVQFLTKKLNKQVLFVAPQINLMEQTKEEFQELFPLIIHGKEDNTSHNVLISTLQTASRRDINTVESFMERCLELAHEKWYMAMINQHSWMFLSSYEALRIKILENHTIDTLVHLGAKAFEEIEIGGEVVQSVAFVLQKENGNG